MRTDSPPSLDLPGFALRQIERRDRQQWFDYLSLPDVHERTSWNLRGPEDLDPLFESFESTLATSPRRLAVIDTSNERLAGTIGFHTISDLNRSAEIAYDLAPAYWGRGLATYLCERVTRWGFGALDFIRVQGRCSSEMSDRIACCSSAASGTRACCARTASCAARRGTSISTRDWRRTPTVTRRRAPCSRPRIVRDGRRAPRCWAADRRSRPRADGIAPRARSQKASRAASAPRPLNRRSRRAAPSPPRDRSTHPSETTAHAAERRRSARHRRPIAAADRARSATTAPRRPNAGTPPSRRRPTASPSLWDAGC
ncbi:acetyltransferase (GNAT) domain-containing protein [Ditylenchus destructor]|nr:acetyltransferase (GNAT) domain-containing protein [Ditylenchus destructor]